MTVLYLTIYSSSQCQLPTGIRLMFVIGNINQISDSLSTVPSKKCFKPCNTRSMYLGVSVSPQIMRGSLLDCLSFQQFFIVGVGSKLSPVANKRDIYFRFGTTLNRFWFVDVCE